MKTETLVYSKRKEGIFRLNRITSSNEDRVILEIQKGDSLKIREVDPILSDLILDLLELHGEGSLVKGSK